MAKAKLDKNTVRIEFLSGDSLGVIAKRYGVDKSSVRGCLRRQGINTNRGRTKRLNLDERAVIECYEECETARIVAQEFGVSEMTIYRILKRNSIQRTHRHSKESRSKWISNCRSKFCPSLIVMLRTVSDMKPSDIARLLDCGLSTVTNVLMKRGLQQKKPTRRTDVDMAALEREYINGATTYELGERYGVNHATISKWMRSLGHIRGKLNSEYKEQICECCGKRFVTNAPNTKFCSSTCRNKGRESYRKRAEKFGVEYDPSVTLKRVYKRDGGICKICGMPCDWLDTTVNGGVGKRYPSIDHIIAMVNGGGHTWGNSQLAHHYCNSIKRDHLSSDDYNIEELKEVITHAKEQAIAHKCA